jgi:small subunit ribosomal protein S21
MIKIEVNKGIEHALKLYKNRVLKSGQINELRNRKEFVKPSVKKRTQKMRAQYIQKIKDGLI